ncbi:MAG: hypothetical protein ABFD49_03190 [Armatimonadota bacterium]|nr:hypothetical protein [bacterium]
MEEITKQKFTVTIEWSPESGQRVTEGDIKEAVEELALDVDEDAVVEVEETFG